MSLTADVAGVDALASTLDAASADLLDLNLTPLGDRLVNAALPRTPRRTGKLAATVRADSTGDTVTLAAGSSSVAYAGFVHAANPWLAATITAQTDTATESVAANVDDIVSTIRGA